MDIVYSSTNVESALHYASLGIKVFPVHGMLNGSCSCCYSPCQSNSKPGKHPACAHGWKDATTDEATIRAWFNGQPWLNVGIAPGIDTLGLDIDLAKGGSETLAKWEAEHGPLPTTPQVRTGSKGFHYYMALPEGVVVKNKAGIAPGIDTRSLGGYLVAPPSVHECGGRYEWLKPLTTPMALAPDWLLDIVAEKVGTSTPKPKQTDIFKFTVKDEPIDFSSHPGEGESNRHKTLCRLAGIHVDRGDSLRSIEAMAIAWNERCNPPKPEAEILRTVQGIFAKDEAKRQEFSSLPFPDSHAQPEDEKQSQSPEEEFSSLPFPEFPTQNESQSPEGEALASDALSPFPLVSTNTQEEKHEQSFDNGESVSYSFSKSESKSKANSEAIAFSYKQGESEFENDEQELNDEHSESPEVEAQSDEQEQELKAPADEWPLLSPEALYGIAGDIVRAIAPETEADPVSILLSLLTAFGNAVGKCPHFALASGIHHANLFTAIVGDTASGKGQSWGIIQSLMRQADAEWNEHSIAYGLSSGEGLVDRLKDEESDEPKQGFFGFATPEAKRLLCLETEFARPITAMRREGNTLSPLLRSAWDSQTLEVLTRGKSKIRASNAHVSIIAHITPEELAKLLSGSVEVANGFSNRFLWACVRRSNILPEGGNPYALDAFVEPLKQAIAKAKGIRRVVRDDEAKALWAEVYPSLSASKPGAFGMATGRGHAQTLRLSLLYALLDGSDTVKVEHLRAALAVWRYCELSASAIFGSENGDTIKGKGERGQSVEETALDFRLLSAIENAPGIRRSELIQATQSRKRGEVPEALASLVGLRLAHPKMVHVESGGRPAECWYPGPNDEPSPSSEDYIPDEGEVGEGKGREVPQAMGVFKFTVESGEGKGIELPEDEDEDEDELPFYSLPFPNFPTQTMGTNLAEVIPMPSPEVEDEPKEKVEAPTLAPSLSSFVSTQEQEDEQAIVDFLDYHGFTLDDDEPEDEEEPTPERKQSIEQMKKLYPGLQEAVEQNKILQSLYPWMDNGSVFSECICNGQCDEVGLFNPPCSCQEECQCYNDNNKCSCKEGCVCVMECPQCKYALANGLGRRYGINQLKKEMWFFDEHYGEPKWVRDEQEQELQAYKAEQEDEANRKATSSTPEVEVPEPTPLASFLQSLANGMAARLGIVPPNLDSIPLGEGDDDEDELEDEFDDEPFEGPMAIQLRLEIERRADEDTIIVVPEPTPEPMAESEALSQTDFLDALSSPTATTTPEDSYEMETYEHALALQGLTPEDAIRIDMLKPYQRDHIKWSQGYALAQAKEKANREREARANAMSEEDFHAALTGIAMTDTYITGTAIVVVDERKAEARPSLESLIVGWGEEPATPEDKRFKERFEAEWNKLNPKDKAMYTPIENDEMTNISTEPATPTPSLFPAFRPALPATLEEMYPGWTSETIAKYKLSNPDYKQYLRPIH
jgi:hypothetical protein